MCLRNWRSASPLSVVRSTPSTRMRPAVGFRKPTTQRTAVVLPDPDSPTMAWVVPRRTLNDTPSRARKALRRRRRPPGSPASGPRRRWRNPSRTAGRRRAADAACQATARRTAAVACRRCAVPPAPPSPVPAPGCGRPAARPAGRRGRRRRRDRASPAAPRCRSRACSSSIRSRMRRCTVTSSALVGSSATISAGLSATAMAISTRCFMPPESSCGYWLARISAGVRPTRVRRSSTLGLDRLAVAALVESAALRRAASRWCAPGSASCRDPAGSG